MIATDISKSQDRLEAALAKARQLGASGARVSCVQGEAIHASFEAGRLKDTGSEESFAVSVDVLVAGRRAQASARRIQDLDGAVERAIQLAPIGSASHFAAWPVPTSFTPVKVHSETTATLTRETLIEAGARMTDILKACDPDLYIGASAARSESQGILLTSGGVIHRSARTGWSLSAEVQRTRGTDMLMDWNGRSWCDVNAFFDPPAIVAPLVEHLRHADQHADSVTGRVRVFLPPQVLMMFLWPMFAGLSGRAAARKESPLADKLGQCILDPGVTIVDDPHREFCRGSSEIDDDGVPTRRQSLVEKGVLQRFLYDVDSAGLAGAEPTGNRGCQPYYPVISRGTRTSAELLKAMPDGLYLTPNLIGFGQGNIMNGDFSCNVGLGFRIRNGEIAGRIKNTMIAGNLYEILRHGVELSSDTEHEGHVPYAVVEGVTASA